MFTHTDSSPPFKASLLLPFTSDVVLVLSSRWSLGIPELTESTDEIFGVNHSSDSLHYAATSDLHFPPRPTEVRVHHLIFLLLSLLISSPVRHVQPDMEWISGSTGLNPAQESSLSLRFNRQFSSNQPLTSDSIKMQICCLCCLCVFRRLADGDRHSSHLTGHQTPRSLCSKWPGRVTRGKVVKMPTMPLMATSGTAQSTTKKVCFNFGSASFKMCTRYNHHLQRQHWQLPLLTRPGSGARLCGQCHTNRHQLPQHHGSGPRGAGPSDPPPSSPQRFLPSTSTPSVPPPAGVVRDQPVVCRHSDL